MNDPFASSSVPLSAELVRISKLPRRVWAPERAEELARELTQVLRTPHGTMELRPIQAIALCEIGTVGGMLGPMTVGSGKTLVSLLAGEVLEATRPLLIVPAALVKKTEKDAAVLAQHWRFPEFTRVRSYELLGRVQAAELLHKEAPDLIVFDEGHRVRNPKAAVTRRVRRFLAEHRGVRCVVLSGTMTKRSLFDYAHLARWSLPANGCPLPKNYTDLEFWADALDERKEQICRAEPGALKIFCNEEEAREWDMGAQHSAARKAFRRRLIETEGVVASYETAVDASLTIQVVEPPPSSVIDAAFKTLRTWETLDGFPIADGLTMFRHARELALGFYYAQVSRECRKKLSQSVPMLKRGLRVEDLIRLLVPEESQGLAHTLRSSAKNEKKETCSTDEKIVSAFSGTTERGARREQQSRGNALRSNTVTGSLSLSTKRLSLFREGLAISAESLQSNIGSASITTTDPAAFVESSAFLATEHLGFSEIEKRTFAEFYSICRRLFRPPEPWLEARRVWCAFVRKILANSRKLDSELQVARAFSETEEYRNWMSVKEDYDPDHVPVWIDDSVLGFVSGWAQDRKGIVWTEHQCVGDRLARDFGLPYFGKKGVDKKGLPIEQHPAGEPLVASVQSNSTGRNLQAWSTNLVVSPPPNGQGWEQLLGRTHREGQMADEVYVDVLMSCVEHVGAFDQALKDSQYVFESTGAPQKLLLAGISVLEADDIVFREGARWSKKEGKEE